MSRPWMPFYIADYLADTGHLSTLEHGAYMLLIMHYWQHSRLPDDESKLARICRMTSAEWSASRETLADLFDDGWKHGRIDAEIERADEKYRKRAEAGQRGGKAKANAKQSSSNATENSSIATAGLNQPQPHSSNEESYTADARGQALDARMPELYAALGVADETKAPGLLSLSAPLQWLRAGCDFDADILPTLRSIAARGKRPRAWAYCSDAVFEARDRRLAPAPDIRQRATAPPPKPRNAGELARIELEAMRDGYAPGPQTRLLDQGDESPGFAGTSLARRIAVAAGGRSSP